MSTMMELYRFNLLLEELKSLRTEVDGIRQACATVLEVLVKKLGDDLEKERLIGRSKLSNTTP